jgi:long-chain acyl-CoA synthetase
MDENTPTFLSLFQDSIRSNWPFRALSDFGGRTFTYRDTAARILRIHAFFRSAGVNRGDKVALLGKNSAGWGIVYIATITYGAVIVPILPDFKPSDVQNIVHHSDSVILFSEESLWTPLEQSSMPQVLLSVRIQDHSILFAASPELKQVTEDAFMTSDGSAESLTPEQVVFPVCGAEDPCVISYTSGTTGFSKGVVLPHRSLLGNMLFARRNMPLEPKDRILSFLSLAHTYGCAFEFLFPFTLGCDITFLTKSPTPKIIMQAFQEIRPALILSVPLVIE